MADPLVAFDRLVPARFVRREKRFIVHVELEESGASAVAHLADPGRLAILRPGARVYLSGPYPAPRKLAWSLRLVETTAVSGAGSVLVSVESTLANRAVPTWHRRTAIAGLPDAELLRTEVKVATHRFDLGWPADSGHSFLAEIKTVGHALPDGRGAWPDAPSKRGLGHVRHLTQLAEEIPTALVFVASRQDIRRIVPHGAVDPAIAEAIAAASAAGVKLIGLRLRVELDGAYADGEIPVALAEVTR